MCSEQLQKSQPDHAHITRLQRAQVVAEPFMHRLESVCNAQAHAASHKRHPAMKSFVAPTLW